MRKNPRSMIHSFRSKVVGFFFVMFFGFLATNFTFGLDLLEQSYQQSKQYDTVVDVGNNKNAVGNELIRGGTTINLGPGQTLQQTDPLLVRIIKWLLRIMAILGVSMGIYVGIQYIMSQGDATKEKEAINNLVKIAVGIILALSAIAIVNLVQSITRSSISL